MKLPRLSLVSFTCLLFTATATLADSIPTPPKPPSSHEEEEVSAMQADFAWFDSLHLADFQGLPLVRVQNGSWRGYANDDKPPEPVYTHGFLIGRTAKYFAILSTELERTVYQFSDEDPAPYKHIGFTPESLKDFVAPLAEAHPAPFDTTQPISLFVLARICDQRGLTEESHRLYLAFVESIKSIDPSPIPRRKALADQLSSLLLNRELHHIGFWNETPRSISDAGISFIDDSDFADRPQLQQRFQFIADTFSNPHAQRTANILKRMIAEDARHHTPSEEEWLHLTTDQQVSELIFELRDQHGTPSANNNQSDIFNDSYLSPDNPSKGHSPAHRLVAIGWPAIPQLINALEDDSFSRSGVYGSGFDGRFRYAPITVSDCALAVLQRITEHNFKKESLSGSDMSASRAAAQAWWDSVQGQDQLSFLTKAVESAGPDSPSQAAILIERYPDHAYEALSKGIESATDRNIKEGLLRLASTHPHPALARVLEEQAASTANPMNQCLAAIGCYRLHADADTPADRTARTEALNHLSQIWNRIAAVSDTVDPDDQNRADQRNFLFEVLKFNRPDIFPVLRTGWNDLSLGARQEALRTAFDIYKTNGTRSEMRSAAETFLAAALDDLDASTRIRQETVQGLVLAFPRIADLAVNHLCRLNPGRYPKATLRTLADLERLRVDYLNTWLAANDNPLVEVPSTPVSTSSRAHTNQVVRIRWRLPADTDTPPAEWTSAAEALQDRDLVANDYLQLVLLPSTHPSASFNTLTVEAVREPDGLGICLTLLPASNKADKNMLDYEFLACANSETIKNSGGGYSSWKGWLSEQLEPVNQALSAPASTRVVLVCALTAPISTQQSP